MVEEERVEETEKKESEPDVGVVDDYEEERAGESVCKRDVSPVSARDRRAEERDGNEGRERQKDAEVVPASRDRRRRDGKRAPEGKRRDGEVDYLREKHERGSGEKRPERAWHPVVSRVEDRRGNEKQDVPDDGVHDRVLRPLSHERLPRCAGRERGDEICDGNESGGGEKRARRDAEPRFVE